MATDTTVPQETWRDWLAPGQAEPRPLLTRAELVARTRAFGVKVSPVDLYYWEYTGVLPRAVKRWHEGAVRALYPEWFPYLILSLRDAQEAGKSLDEIAALLRDTFYQSLAKSGGSPLISIVEQSVLAFGHETVLPALVVLARRFEQRTGQRVAAVRLELLGDGDELPVLDKKIMYLTENE